MSSTYTVTDKDRKQIDRLFARFAVFYGHIWRSQFKNDGFLEFAKQEWLDGLSQFDEDIITRAIIECRDSFEMPPTLPQIIHLCRGIKKRINFFVAGKAIEKALPEVAEKHLKACRNYLNRSHKEKNNVGINSKTG